MLKNMSDTNKLLIIVIVFLLMIFYILYTSIKDSEVKDYSFIDNYINSIDNDYMLDIFNDNREIVYYKQQNVEHFVSESFEHKHYIKEDGKLYYVDNNQNIDIEFTNDLDDRYYYDFNFIKRIIPYCKYNQSYNNTYCNIKADDFNKELLSLYGIGNITNDISIFFNIRNDSIESLNINNKTNNYKINILKTPNLELLTK